MRQVDGTEALNRVRQMRREPTEAERILWRELRGRRFEGVKFRRQVWLGAFIADFLCAEAKLIVELDGAQHGETVAYDARRDRDLAAAGYRTLRFWNGDVAGNLTGVLEAIRVALLVPSPSHAARGPLPLPRGEGR